MMMPIYKLILAFYCWFNNRHLYLFGNDNVIRYWHTKKLALAEA